MRIRQVLTCSKLAIAATLIASWLLTPGTARAEGDFLEPFEPDYPTGAAYEAFTANLKALGLLQDSDDPDSNLNNERCTTESAVGLQTSLFIEKAVQVPAEILCDGVLEPATRTACSIALAVTGEAIVITELFIAQCDFQDSSVDGAEIEAGYENTVKLLSLNTKVYEKQIEDNLLSCRPVVGLFLPEDSGGLSEWVRMLVSDRIDQFDDAIDAPRLVEKALRRLDRGDRKFDAGRYKKAYRSYCSAYTTIARGPKDDDDDDDDHGRGDDDDDDGGGKGGGGKGGGDDDDD